MRANLDYSNTYKEALMSNNPIKFLEKRWGSANLYFNEFILPFVEGRRDLSIVEIGCGLGRYTQKIIPFRKILYGIEPEKSCCEFLKTKFGIRNNTFSSSIKTVIIPSNTIDLIFSFSTMLHFNLYEIYWYFKNLIKKAKDNSTWIIHYMSLENGGIDIFAKQPCPNFDDMGRYIFHNPLDILSIARHLGLDLIQDYFPRKPLIKGHKVMILSKHAN